MSRLRAKVVRQDGSLIQELSGFSIPEMGWLLDQPGQSTLNISPLAPSAQALLINECEVQFWVDEVLRWWGVPRSVRGNSKSLSFVCEEIISHFFYRVVGAGTLTYTSIDQFAIASNLVSYAQTGTNMDRNIAFATVAPSGITRSRQYDRNQHQVILDLLKEFPTLDRGFDFEVKIYGDGRREFTPYYPHKGTTWTNISLEWGKNVVDFNDSEDGTAQTNDVYVVGGSSNNVRFEQHWTDAARAARYGIMQKVISEGSQEDLTWLLDRGKAEVLVNGDPVKLPELTVKNDPYPLFGVIGTGDIIPVNVQVGRVHMNDNYRIVGITRLPNNRLKLAFNTVQEAA